jgi:hypothetical protein
MRHILGLVMVIGLSLVGCAEEGAYVTVAPPPVQAEVVGVAPYPGAVWIGGYWGWEGGRHMWHGGYWTRGRPGYVWQPHRWEPRGGGYVYFRGGWRRR